MPVFHWDLSLGNLVVALTFIVSAWKVIVVVKKVVIPVVQVFEEHNVLWEDYNIRTGGPYRRRTGRGAPPEPSEFYRQQSLNQVKVSDD